MLKNLDVPFSDRVLESKACELIRRFSIRQHWEPDLPVPVDEIIEHELDLCIEYAIIAEPPGSIVWGSIEPGRKVVTVNESRLAQLQRYPGLERFTLAHEVGHWTMHVDHGVLHQPSLFGHGTDIIICRDGDDSVQEQVANRFASFLLMPTDLMLRIIGEHDVGREEGMRALASAIGVSLSALRIRLSKMGVGHMK